MRELRPNSIAASSLISVLERSGEATQVAMARKHLEKAVYVQDEDDPVLCALGGYELSTPARRFIERKVLVGGPRL